MASPAAVLNILISANNLQAKAALTQTQAQLAATGKSATRTSAVMKKAFLGIGVAAAGAAAGLYKIGEAFDDSYDTIRTQTGATGKEMVKLKRSFRDVVRSVPADFETASKAVAGVSQRLDATGKPLGRLSKQFSELARITGTDVDSNIQSVARSFKDWEVRTAKQSEQLDRFFRASQASGASVDDLAQSVVQFGAPLRQLGFTLDEATAMFAAFEEAGVNTQTMMPGLRFALRAFMEAGRDPQKALQKTFEGIASGTIKAQEAFEIFGARATPDMIEAIQQGRFELDKMTKALAQGDSSIRKTGRETMDLAEHWQQFKNLLALELEPVAKRVFKGLSSLMKELSSTFRREGITGVFDLLLEKLSETLTKAVELAAEQGPKIASALLRGFLNAGAWGTIAGGVLIAKMFGGLGAMRKSATSTGKAAAVGVTQGMTTGIVAGSAFSKFGERFQKTTSGLLVPAGTQAGTAAGTQAGTSFMGSLGSKLSGLKGKALGIGKGILGVNLALGALQGIASQAPTISGKLQDTFSSITFGITPSFAEDEQATINSFLSGFLKQGGITELQSDLVQMNGTFGQLSKRTAEWRTTLKLARDEGNLSSEAYSQLTAQLDKGWQAFERGREKMDDLREDAQQLRRGFADSWGQIRGNLEDNLRRIEQSMGTHSKQGQKLVSQNFQAAVGSIKEAMKNGYIAVDRGGQLIANLIRKRLSMMGIQGPDAEKIISAGTAHATGSPAPPGGKQRGGSISMVPGVGVGDKVPAMLEPGEVVINKKAVAAMGGAQKVNRINQEIPRFQKGGGVGFPTFSSPYPAFMPHAEQLNRLADAAEKLVQNAKPSPPAGGPASKGPDGIGTYAGLPMANWVIESLRHAASKGVNPQPTSGYRSHAYNVSQGRTYYSEHEGTKYPHGAVDYGSYTTGLAEKMSVVNATRDFKYPLLAPIGFRDDGHASGTGHMLGGIIKRLARGGMAKGTGLGLGRKSVLNINELTTLAAKVGMRNPALMAAIAMAESSGNASVAGDGGDSIGLWQINTPAWPQFSAAKLTNPVYNAKAAKTVLAQQGLGAWSVYNSGAYRNFLGGQVLSGATTSGGGGGGGGHKPPKPPASTLPLHGSMGYQHLPPALKKALTFLRKHTAMLEERIANADIIHAMVSSEAGTDLGPGETAAQVALYDQLLATLMDRVRKIKKGIDFAPGGPRASRLREELEGLIGITGEGGRILEVRAALDALRGSTSAAGGPDWEAIAGQQAILTQQANQRFAVSQAQYGVLGQAHGGLPYVPRTGTYLLEQGEAVVPKDQNGGVQVLINGDIINTPRGKQPVEIVKQGSRRMGRTVLPGARGF